MACKPTPYLIDGYRNWQRRRDEHKHCCRQFKFLGTQSGLLIHRDSTFPNAKVSQSHAAGSTEIRFRSKASWSESTILNSDSKMAHNTVVLGINWTNEYVIGMGWTGHSPISKDYFDIVDPDELNLFWHTNIGWALMPVKQQSREIDSKTYPCSTSNISFLTSKAENCRRCKISQLFHVALPSIGIEGENGTKPIIEGLRLLASRLKTIAVAQVIIPLGRLYRLGFTPSTVAQIMEDELLKIVRKLSGSVTIEFLFGEIPLWQDDFSKSLIRLAHLSKA